MAENHNKKALTTMSPFRRHNSQKTSNLNFMMGTASFPHIPTEQPKVQSNVIE